MRIIKFSLQFVMCLSSLDMPGLQHVGGMRAFVYYVDTDSTYMQQFCSIALSVSQNESCPNDADSNVCVGSYIKQHYHEIYI